MAKILLVDDDRAIQQSLSRHLSRQGFQITPALDAGQALSRLRTDDFDLMLLDIGLPDVDGVTFCRRVRKDWRLPIIMLTARSDGSDKVVGLEVGADDYVTKPFELSELVARVRAQLRRAGEYSTADGSPECYTFGPLKVDAGLRDAVVEGRSAGLTSREFDLLFLLARNHGRVLEKSWILEQVWGYDAELGLKVLAVYVRRLRQKIERDPDNPQLLHTVRGYGYKLAVS